MSSTLQSPSQRARIFFPLTWSGTGGMRDVLVLTGPLVLSNAVNSINLFLDRTLLAWHSQESFAAALQGGVAWWTAISVFLQTIVYTTTFVAQYQGAGSNRSIGPAMWQAIYMALISGVLLALCSGVGFPLFRWIGHAGELPRLEAEYFQVLALGTITCLLNGAIHCFFAGRGKTGIVLFANAASLVVNACLNVWMIFDEVWIFPDGIKGAAWATVISQAFCFLVYLAFMLARKEEYEREFALFSAWKLQLPLMRRILRFALPSGVHQTVEVFGFTVFLQVIGVFGMAAQLASNMAMNINMLLFIPAIGLHISTSILAGQYCGAKDLVSAQRMSFHAAVACSAYMAVVIIFYLFFSTPVLELFRGGMHIDQWQPLLNLSRSLLIFVACYSFFDGIFLVYSGMLKGAGDTKFVMYMAMLFSTFVLTIPCLVLVHYRELMTPATGLLIAWGLCANYVVTLAVTNLIRYHRGTWMRIDMLQKTHWD